jgi:hypothetical protein
MSTTIPAGSRLLAEDLLAITSLLDDAWSTWTPTLTNLTLGSGVIVARYKQIGRRVDYRFRFTLGAGSAVGTSPRFTLPVAPIASPAYVTFNDPLGDGQLADTGTANRRASVHMSSGSTVEIYSYSTTGVLTVITATVPHTWASTDVIAISGTYEAA